VKQTPAMAWRVLCDLYLLAFTPLGIDQLSTFVGTHPGAEATLTGAFNFRYSMWIMHNFVSCYRAQGIWIRFDFNNITQNRAKCKEKAEDFPSGLFCIDRSTAGQVL
jgi:hypothetical protein